MDRRTFIATGLATLAVPGLSQALTGQSAGPLDVLQALGRGEVVFVDFFAPGCAACQAQAQVVTALKAQDGRYAQAMRFLAVDWAQHGQSELAQVLQVSGPSTLIVLKADREYGRIVAATDPAGIKRLMDAGLAAARG